MNPGNAGNLHGDDNTRLQAAYILHYTPWRDTSFILDVFTFRHGRLGLMARGARAAKPRTRALYQPFRPLLISWTGRGELRTLTGIEESGALLSLQGNTLACGYYLNELVLRLFGKDQAQTPLFAFYTEALSSLATGVNAEQVLRTFELHVLDALGVLPAFDRCVVIDEGLLATQRSVVSADATGAVGLVEPASQYRFHPAQAIAMPLAESDDYGVRDGDAGGEVPMHPDGVTEDAGFTVHGATLLALSRFDLSAPTVRRESRPLLRKLMALQLGDRPLKSREMFDTSVPLEPAGDAEHEVPD